MGSELGVLGRARSFELATACLLWLSPFGFSPGTETAMESMVEEGRNAGSNAIWVLSSHYKILEFINGGQFEGGRDVGVSLTRSYLV
jgi:hypothetical protein